MNGLHTACFVAWALFWAVYFALEAASLGLGVLMPCLARNEAERRVMREIAAPFRHGNEAWLIAALGLTFAAFPQTFALLFGALHAPLTLFLFALILRAVACLCREQAASPRRRAGWDAVNFAGSLAACLLLGLIFANLFQKPPLAAGGATPGGFSGLLNPYALCGGALFTAMAAYLGLLRLAWQGVGPPRYRAALWARTLWLFLLGLLLLFLAASGVFTGLYAGLAVAPPLAALPLTALAAFFTARFAPPGGPAAWLAGCLFIICLSLFGLSGMFPHLVPAGPLTLKIMLAAAGVFAPLAIACQVVAQRVFSRPTQPEATPEPRRGDAGTARRPGQNT